MAEAKAPKARKTLKTAKKKAEDTEIKAKKEAELIVETAPAQPLAAEEPVKETAKAGNALTSSARSAKAGRRSAKSVRETEEKAAKEAKKIETAKPDKAKPAAKPPRSKAERAGRRYKEAAKLIDKSKVYPLAEALDLVVKTANTNFDSSVELHVNLGVDPKQADQNVRDSVVLPAGTGKAVRVATVSDDVGAEKLFAKLDKEEIDFDVLIATPAVMPKLGKYARLLGPRGLMPNPKSGTVTQNIEAAASEAKAGKVEYRVDQAGIVHLSIGRASFGADKLAQNAEAVLSSIRSARPASLKGIYIKSAYLTSTMGPSAKLDVSS